MQTMEKAIRTTLLEDYAAQDGEFTLFDFGIGTTVMPVSENGQWLTSTITFVMLRGHGKPSGDVLSLPRKEGEVLNMDFGWFVTPVEITLISTAEELRKKFDAAEKLLLKARDEAKKE